MVSRATWSSLFPAPVVVVDAAVRDEVAALLPEERAEIAKAIDKRRFEYSSARVCAHRAMAQLGVPDAPLLNGPGRDPRWPSGVVGSLAHSKGWCAAAVGLTPPVRAIGIDLEPDDPLDPPLWPHVATKRELAWLQAQPPVRRGRAARLLFSAKEAFYKCQFPSTRQFLGFEDVELECDLAPGEFRATLQRPAGTLRRGDTFSGRFAVEDGLLITAMTWLDER
jgi:4'-phosphopantetheinyl transferase EntD